MNLILEILEQEKTPKQVYTLRDDGTRDSPLRVSNHDVCAMLSGDFSDCCEYWLYVGQDPDVVAKVKKGDGIQVPENPGSHCAWFTKKHARDKVFRLFQSTMGWTYLRLDEMAYDEDGVIYIVREVMAVPVYVIPNEVYRQRYVAMMKDLMDVPQFFLDDLKGQMLLNGFGMEWDDGYSSHDDAAVELDAVKDVLSQLRSPIEDICRAPKTRLLSVRRRMNIERIGHCSSRSNRRIERCRDGEIVGRRVVAEKKILSYDVDAHCVIRYFLRRLACRCDEIWAEFLAAKNALDSEGRDLANLYKDARKDSAFIGRTSSNLRQIGELEKKICEAKRTKEQVLEYAARPIFRGLIRPLRIFDVTSISFTGSVGYERAYRLMLGFERQHFWWIGTASNSYKIPRLRQRKQESRWVRKYSMVYEFWCCHRMLKALVSNGFTLIDGKALSSKDGSRCVFRRDTYEIEIVHGISAKCSDQWNGYADSEFWLDSLSQNGVVREDANRFMENARERTPDFAIVFRNLATRKMKWIVADAKSDSKLRSHIIQKREKYLRFVKRRPDLGYEGNADAAQVWIFYAGEDEGTTCGVECPPLQPKSFDEKDFFDSQAGVNHYTFSPSDGIVFCREGDLPRGHIHANIDSLGQDNSPFEDFVLGEIATMARELG